MKRRMFIDPASISTGWAVFRGRYLLASGTVAANAQAAVFTRLGELYHHYRGVMERLEAANIHPGEAYFECIPPRCAREVYWSVGAIGAALAPNCAVHVNTLLMPPRWQKAVGWQAKEMRRGGPDRGLSPDSPLREYVSRVQSQDELAAIGMGLYYLWL